MKNPLEITLAPFKPFSPTGGSASERAVRIVLMKQRDRVVAVPVNKMNKQKALQLLALGVALGGMNEVGAMYKTDERTAWQKYSDSFNALCKPRLKVGRCAPIRTRHLSPTIRGKKNVRADKRARHAAMKQQ